jgi:hypothetical protein
MTRINLINRVTVPAKREEHIQRNGRVRTRQRVAYTWLVYRYSVVFVPGVGRLASWRQEIPFTYRRPGNGPRLNKRVA